MKYVKFYTILDPQNKSYPRIKICLAFIAIKYYVIGENSLLRKHS